MKRGKLNLIIKELGGSGGSYIASNLGDQYRLHGKECAVYSLDVEQAITLHRLGERDEEGILLPIQNNPLKGVLTFDILNQLQKNPEIAQQEVKKMLKSFANDYDYSVYDFPGQGRSQFQKVFGENELAITLDLVDKDVNVIIPVSEKKSLVNIPKVQEMFTFKGEFEAVNSKIKFFTFFNPIRSTNVDLTHEAFLNSKEYKDIAELGERHVHIHLQNIDAQVLEAIKDRPISYYYDFERNRPKNISENEALSDIGLIEVGIHLRRVLLDPTPGADSGFYHIVPKYFF